MIGAVQADMQNDLTPKTQGNTGATRQRIEEYRRMRTSNCTNERHF
jgi:hypothetical protein